MHLGTAFQLVDDVLDYSGSVESIGKSLGDDLAEGKMTLPLIRAMTTGSPDDAALIRHAISGGGLTDFAPVVSALDTHRRARLRQGPAPKARSGARASAWPDSPILRTGKIC